MDIDMSFLDECMESFDKRLSDEDVEKFSDVSTTVGAVKKIYNDGDFNFDDRWFIVGYLFAKGVIGTGWMSDNAWSCLNDFENEFDDDPFVNHGIGYARETIQFQYEVGKYMEDESLNDGEDVDVYKKGEYERRWAYGYGRGMKEKLIYDLEHHLEVIREYLNVYNKDDILNKLEYVKDEGFMSDDCIDGIIRAVNELESLLDSMIDG